VAHFTKVPVWGSSRIRAVRGFKPLLSGFGLALVFCAPVEAAPLAYLTGSGEKAAPVVALTWGVMVISLAVIIIITALLAAAIWKNPSRVMAVGEKTAIGPDEGGHNWLWIGVGLSSLVLLFTVVWTVVVLADIQAPGVKPDVTIEVTGRQWWWQVHYITGDERDFITANEIHIPTGEPIRLKLIGGDVIHSFWVPQLAGKMDAIPGQINETWIEASKPGVYQGQCTEYCGVEHAKMLFRVVAQSPADFRAWWTHQLAPASAASGQQAFVKNCGRCHSMRGTAANGALGPDLSHVMARQTIASGVLPNNARMIAAWIANPQSFKPGSLMPAVKLSDSDRAGITAYLVAQN
jgi:cytochrome c oxidase subunit 2